jgi:hypothetical protein
MRRTFRFFWILLRCPGLQAPKRSKEDIAREIAERDKVRQGPICVLKTVELCRSYEVAADRETKRIELRSRQRKCLHLYHYMIHLVFGFMHVRFISPPQPAHTSDMR